MNYAGDFPEDATVYLYFTSSAAAGGAVAPASAFEAADIRIYKNGSATEKATPNGITVTSPFDSVTGLHMVAIDTSNDAGDVGFWASGADYTVVLQPASGSGSLETVDGQTVVAVLAQFSCNNRSHLRPTVAGRTLDVSSGGEAGVDWANVGSPTTAVNLSGTTIAITQQVDVNTIKTNPVVNGGTVTFPSNATLASTTNITAGTVTTATNVTTVNGLAAGVITAVSIAADAITAAKIADGAIDAATFAAGAIDAAAIAADAIGSSELAASAASEIAAAVRTELATELGRIDAATSTRASQTSLDTLDDYVDSEVAAIKAVTDRLDQTLEDPGTGTGSGGLYRFTKEALAAAWDEPLVDHLVSGSTGSALNAAGAAGDPWSTSLPGAYGAGTAGKIVGDNLNATVSSRASQTSLDTLDDYVDSEVAAIKAKTDQLTFGTANRVDCQVYGMQADTLTASALAADAVSEVQSGLSTLNAAGVRTAVGLASANLDTQLAAIAGYIDTEVAAALAAVDTEVGAIKAATDQMVFTTANRLNVQVYGMEAGTLTAGAVAAGAIDADAIAADAANEIADALLDRTAGVETNRTVRQALRLMLAALVGKISGAATTTVVIRDTNDSVDRVTATVDSSGNRSSVTLNQS